MNESQLETFLTVTEYKSYSKAANVLNVTQPAITSRIKALEDHLKFELFERVGHEISVTKEGSIFVEYAENILIYIRQAKDIINMVKEPLIKVGFSPGYSYSFIVEMLKTIKTIGGIDVQVIEGYDSSSLNERALVGEVDLIFTRDALINNESMISEYLFDNNPVIALSKKHPLSQKKILQLEDLNEETIISYKRNSPFWKLIDKKLINLKNVTRIDVDNNEMLLRAVLNEIGIGIIPELAFDKRYHEELTMKKINEISKIPNKVYVHYRKTSQIGPLAKQIIYSIINHKYNETY